MCTLHPSLARMLVAVLQLSRWGGIEVTRDDGKVKAKNQKKCLVGIGGIFEVMHVTLPIRTTAT